jgi:predicted AAA+ superfamily ATPase
MEFLPRFFDPPDRSFFLFGPRGTGKSSWIRNTYKGALVVDLLRPDVYREMIARPERLAELVLADPNRQPVVVDEVQRVPELLNVVHDLIERGTGLQFILTGSSARKLRRGGVDLLAGRALNRSLHPFMAAELPDFTLDRALQIGTVPIVVASQEPEDVLRAYASLYIDEEVRTEGWARNVGNFSRFLEVVSFSHGAVLNVSNVARDSQIERKTVAAYIEVLEDLLLSFRLPVFSRRAKRQVIAHPKFFYFDAGVFRSLRPKGPLDRPEEIDGAAFEGLVAQHLRAWIAYTNRDFDLYYWRTRAGVEVDFIVYGEDGFWAIEVKNSAAVRSQDLRGLRSFRQDYPECRPVHLYRGDKKLLIDDILCVPGEAFLAGLRPGHDMIDG